MSHEQEQVQAALAARRHAVAMAMRRRMIALLCAGGTTDFADAVGGNAASVYTDPARAERERCALFTGLPLLAGYTRDLEAPGDCLVFDEAGPPILLVRGEDGAVRGFLNMCRHRGTRLVQAKADGRCTPRQRLTCPFHAWSYDLAGRLVGVPGSAAFEGMDTSAWQLVPVPVAEWHGLLFVRACAGSPELDVAPFLASFADELRMLALAQAAPVRSGRFVAACNWKLALDTYAEGYHFATLHASTIGRSHHSNVAVFDEFAPHWRIGFPEKALDALVGVPEAQWPPAMFSAVHFLFPNTVLVVGSSAAGVTFVRTFRLFPGDTPGTMSCRIDVHANTGEGGTLDLAAFAQDDADSEVTREDYGVAEQAQRNLQHAPSGHRLVYGRNEPALQAVHRHIAAALGEAL